MRLAADLAGVDQRRLRDVVGPLVAREELLPPLHPAARQVDRDQRVGARVRARPQSREVERRRRAGAEDTACLSSCRRSSASRRRRRRRCGMRAATTGSPAEPSRTALGQAGFRSVVYAITKPRIPYSEPAAPTISAVVGADRRARLGVAVVRVRVRHVVAERRHAQNLAVRRPQRHELHVELRDEELAVAVGEPPVGGDPEVLEHAAVRRLVLPDHLAGRALEGEDVVVVRRHVEAPTDREGVRLLAPADVRDRSSGSRCCRRARVARRSPA